MTRENCLSVVCAALVFGALPAQSTNTSTLRLAKAGSLEPSAEEAQRLFAVAMVEGLRRSDPAVTRRFLELYAGRVAPALQRLLGPSDDLENLVHDVLVEALEAIDELRQPAELPSWVTGIAVSTAERLLLRQRRWLSLAGPRPATPELPASAQTLDTFRALHRSLSQLRPEDKIAVLLHRVEGLTAERASQVMGISSSAFGRSLRRGERRLLKLAERSATLRNWLGEATRASADAPVARLLREYRLALDTAPPLNINRLEQRVRATLRERARRSGRNVLHLQVALAAAALFAVVSAGVAFKLGEQHAEYASASAVPAGEWVSTTQGVAEERHFEDGSSVRLESESSARVQFVGAKGGLVHLSRGAVRLRVRQHEGASWRVVAGPYEVEAIGTEFVVDWASSRDKPLRVSVSEGTVAVRGPAFRGTRFVSAHQSVEVAAAETSRVESSSIAVSDVAAEAVAGDEPPAAGSALREAAPATLTWRELDAKGRYAEAVQVAERRAVLRDGSAEELLALARAARYAGRPEVAQRALITCRSRFAGSQQASVAAFLLGRSSSGASAAEYFSAYLREQPSGVWAREALGRLIEVHEAAGDRESARAVAERYLESYPDGPHAKLAHEALSKTSR